jgi:hypothetical protein
MASFSTITLFNKTLGKVKIKIDSEDKHLFEENKAYVCLNGPNSEYKVRFMNSGNTWGDYAHRAIMKKNKAFKGQYLHNKSGNFLDLRKSNYSF